MSTGDSKGGRAAQRSGDEHRPYSAATPGSASSRQDALCGGAAPGQTGSDGHAGRRRSSGRGPSVPPDSGYASNFIRSCGGSPSSVSPSSQVCRGRSCRDSSAISRRPTLRPSRRRASSNWVRWSSGQAGRDWRGVTAGSGDDAPPGVIEELVKLTTAELDELKDVYLRVRGTNRSTLGASTGWSSGL